MQILLIPNGMTILEKGQKVLKHVDKRVRLK